MSIPALIVIYVACCSRAVRFGNLFRNAPPPLWPDALGGPDFRCQTCGYVYTDDADVDRSRCAQCGKLNEPIVF